MCTFRICSRNWDLTLVTQINDKVVRRTWEGFSAAILYGVPGSMPKRLWVRPRTPIFQISSNDGTGETDEQDQQSDNPSTIF